MPDTVYLAYTDESGDSGFERSPSRFFVVACLLIHQDHWRGALDDMIEFRRALRDAYGIPTRSELKAEYFVKGRGPFRGLKMSRKKRMEIFADAIEFVASLRFTAFAITVAKERIQARKINDPRQVAWAYLTQRLDTFCRKHDPVEKTAVFPDEGHAKLVRKVIRKGRRFQIVKGRFGGNLDIKAEHIIEDPSDRHSQDSYFTQAADWAAYAAHRSRWVAPIRKVRTDLWDKWGNTRLLAVNDVTKRPEPGIVVWPPPQ